MAIHIINVSIDAPDGYSLRSVQSEQQEDLSVNEIESLGELILEEWLGITDAVPEHSDTEDDFEDIKIEQDYFFYPAFTLVFAPLSWQLPIQSALRKPATRMLKLVQEITPPPPQHGA